MKRPEPDSPEAQRRAHTAADWLVRTDRGLTAAEQDEFLEWLAADPRHGDWLALHRRVVANFNVSAEWRPQHSEEPNPDLLARPVRRARWWTPAVVTIAAAAAVAIGGFAWRATWQPAGERVVTGADAGAVELERRVLEDGSTVDLNRGAAVKVAYSANERRVTLMRGEALFTVTKDTARPFVVRAGGLDVRAVGTAFNVRLDAAAVEVLVTEGTVEVDPPVRGAAGASDRTEAEVPAARIQAGQRATVSRDRAAAPEVVAVTAAETARLLAWQPQLLDFSSAPLERAIAEFNRRNRVQFVLADPELGAMPIVASIRSDRVEGFAHFLAATPGVVVERRGDEIVLRRKP
jgi:transmembrane sensor